MQPLESRLKAAIRLIVRIRIDHQLIDVADGKQFAAPGGLHGFDRLVIRYQGFERQPLPGTDPYHDQAKGSGHREAGRVQHDGLVLRSSRRRVRR